MMESPPALSRNQGAGDHRAEPLHRENTVHGSRKSEDGGRTGTCRLSPSSAWTSSDSPCLWRGDGITGAFSRNEPRVNSRMSSWASSSISSSTRSTFVSATSP